MNCKDTCKIVQDLIPNYLEKLTLEETTIFIQKHIAECNECKRELEEVSNDELSYTEAEEKEIEYLKKIKKKNRLNIVFAVCAILCILMLIFIGCIMYRYSLLRFVENKFEEYAKVDNVYIEINGTEFQNGVFSNAVTRKYWYKDGILKSEELYTAGNEKIISIINYRDAMEYRMNEKNKTVTIWSGSDISSGFEDGKLFETLFKSNYTFTSSSYFSKFLTDMLHINISKEKDIIIHIDNYCRYDKATGLLKMQYAEDFEGNTVLENYKYEFNHVTDENLTLPDITDYKISE